MSRRISLIIGAALAILAAVLVKIYLDNQRETLRMQAQQRAEQLQQNQVPVMIAMQQINPGVPIEPEVLDMVMASADQIPAGIATSYGQVVGKTSGQVIERGEAILVRLLIDKPRQAKKAASLSIATPVGTRAITISVKGIDSVGGMIKPGDHVDVLCTIAVPPAEGSKSKKKEEIIYPVFQNVLVLAVGTELSVAQPYAEGEQPKKASKSSDLITLALTPQEANLLAFVQEQGKLQLVLRSPEDEAIVEQMEPASLEALLEKVLPYRPKRKKTTPTPTKQTDEKMLTGEVEVFHGTDREVVPLYE
ncbi:Flp pilus assembly protein CpaB [Candidatus Omnitrophota bacterium]